MRFLAGLVLLVASPLAAQRSGDGARIVVSRREATITFPRERATSLGWPAYDPDSASDVSRDYRWEVTGIGVYRDWHLSFNVGPDSSEARSFPSLEALVADARGRALGRQEGSFLVADNLPVEMRVLVRDGRLVMHLTDSAVIAEMYALRPEWQTISYNSLADHSVHVDSVRVEYVRPRLPAPTQEVRDRIAARRHAESSSSETERFAIDVAGSWLARPDTSYVALGETVRLSLTNWHCGGDTCSGATGQHAGWTVDDSTILAPPARAQADSSIPVLGVAQPGRAIKLPEVVVLASEDAVGAPFVARRVGSTTVRALGGHSHVIIVRPRPTRVLIQPRPDTIRVGEVPSFTLDVVDTGRGVVHDVAATITYPDSGLRPNRRWYESRRTGLPPGGWRRMIATWNGFADTLTVFVADTIDEPHVEASRREVRITFPRDTTASWWRGWATSDDRFSGYEWTLTTDAVDWSHFVQLHAWRDDGKARAFPSPRALLAATRLVRCTTVSYIAMCAEPLRGEGVLDASGRVVVVLRDSVAIADLFGLRPAKVRLDYSPPQGKGWDDSVRVSYVDPQLPVPSDSFRAAVAERRRIERKIGRWVVRAVRAEPTSVHSYGDTTWLHVNDVVDFSVAEEVCGGDVCNGTFDLAVDSAWIIADTTILRELPDRPRAPGEVVIWSSHNLRAVALRQGTTRIRISGIHSGVDPGTVREPPRSVITQTVIVR